MSHITRREAISTGAVSAAGVMLVAGTSASAAQEAGAVTPVQAFAGKHTPQPLRFNPAKLTGLSERLITSHWENNYQGSVKALNTIEHWENNYQGSVKALNTIETRLAAAMADPDFPPVAYSGLKREELHRTGSVVLHELYFGALGGDGKPAGTIREALAAWFGGFDRWEAEFRRTAMSLAGGSGWCVLAYNRHTASLHNYWAWDHMHAPVNGAPLITLDMYEHSYHMDYGTAAAKYIDAFMANLHWEVIDARYRAAIG